MNARRALSYCFWSKNVTPSLKRSRAIATVVSSSLGRPAGAANDGAAPTSMVHESEQHSSARALNFLIVARTIVAFYGGGTTIPRLRMARRERSHPGSQACLGPGLARVRGPARGRGRGSPVARQPIRGLLWLWLSPSRVECQSLVAGPVQWARARWQPGSLV